MIYMYAAFSAIINGNHDVAPGGEVTGCVLQSRPREWQMYVTVLAPGAPCKFGTRDLHLLLGMSKYINDWAVVVSLARRPSLLTSSLDGDSSQASIGRLMVLNGLYIAI